MSWCTRSVWLVLWRGFAMGSHVSNQLMRSRNGRVLLTLKPDGTEWTTGTHRKEEKRNTRLCSRISASWGPAVVASPRLAPSLVGMFDSFARRS